jgi:hypothetical protein
MFEKNNQLYHCLKIRINNKNVITIKNPQNRCIEETRVKAEKSKMGSIAIQQTWVGLG